MLSKKIIVATNKNKVITLVKEDTILTKIYNLSIHVMSHVNFSPEDRSGRHCQVFLRGLLPAAVALLANYL